jgi:hypothetical protein
MKTIQMGKFKSGDLVIYDRGLFPEVVYRYIEYMGAGVAICEDKDGNRRCFSIRLLTPATPEQIETFNK